MIEWECGSGTVDRSMVMGAMRYRTCHGRGGEIKLSCDACEATYEVDSTRRRCGRKASEGEEEKKWRLD